jgi:hypothetical protein
MGGGGGTLQRTGGCCSAAAKGARPGVAPGSHALAPFGPLLAPFGPFGPLWPLSFAPFWPLSAPSRAAHGRVLQSRGQGAEARRCAVRPRVSSFWVPLGPLWAPFGPPLGPLLAPFGPPFGPLWPPFGPPLGPFASSARGGGVAAPRPGGRGPALRRAAPR